MRELTVTRDDGGQRLDRFLRKYLPAATLGNIFKLLRTGKVRLNGRKAKQDTRIEEGDLLTLRMPDGLIEELRGRAAGGGEARPKPRGKPVRVLYQDEHVLAVDKPAYLLVQPGGRKGQPTLGRQVRGMLGPSGAETFEPSIAHRLDRGTSGVVLFGVSARGLRELTLMFREHRITKRYLALCGGEPAESSFVVDEPLLRETAGEGQAARVRVSSAPGSQHAVTDVDVLIRDRQGRFALVEARPRTGRTHQIRVHLRARRLPIVGDPVYGHPALNKEVRAAVNLGRPFLHAAALEFVHPVTAEPLRITSALPADLVRTLGWAGIPVDRARPQGEDGPA